MDCYIIQCIKSSRSSSYRKGDFYGNRFFMGNPVKEIANAHFYFNIEEANKFIMWQRRNGVTFKALKVNFLIEDI